MRWRTGWPYSTGAESFRRARSRTSVIADALPGPSFAMIRPHSVVLSRHTVDNSSVRNSWSGTITDIDRLGDRVRVGIEGQVTITAEITVAALDALGLRPGVSVTASVKATDIEAYPA